MLLFFFFNDTATTEIYTLSLHDALPIYGRTYNIGLEPFTSYTNEGLGTAVDNGTALLVKAGQKLQSSVTAVAYESLIGIEGVSQCGAIKLKK